MQKSVGKASALLRALANERRLMILCQLVEGEKSVGALAESLDIAQAMISQQLSILRREELVCFRREGQCIYYRLDHPAAAGILQVLYDSYCPK
ncbi:metalloregulator ArsR/SmtB family transcription factor [Kiloniella laminariae]|uniref:Metalloregulator ArsR/SmtB family transcription factor n=1 Tax=Kiloniella laminariae TaxID=454162 RepID=A0ABT4LK92_9PROT|nr:metalloregulator ArsR/SmtB family transcription factor [Kiloniella laminariae]MCZ4281528.1 metalloregulator ArsR/SmtB family transcription factor [Kiloniella laminariae]